MPFGKRKNLTGKANAKRIKLSRKNESCLQHNDRLESQRERDRARREDETDKERKVRLETQSENDQCRRANETEVEHERRLQSQREIDRSRRDKETEAEYEQRLAAQMERSRDILSNETDEMRSKRQEADAERHRIPENEAEIERFQRISVERDNRSKRHPKTYRLGFEPVVEENLSEHSCGEMSEMCEFCKSLNFTKEKNREGNFTTCCQKGKVVLNPLLEFPTVLYDLMNDNHKDSKHFMRKIRNYNSSLAFASMGAQLDELHGNGPYCFRIHGQVYHNTSALHPGEDQTRKFAQIYILDANEDLEQRMGMLENAGCLEPLMDELSSMLNEINPFAAAFKMMRQVELEEIRSALSEGREIIPIEMWIHQDKRNDQRRYNAPASNEVAIVFKSLDGEPPFDRDICIHHETRKLERISILSPNSDPMTYPLLFPRGEKGWQTNIPLMGSRKRVHVSHLEFYSYRWSVRPEFNPILQGGK